MGRRGGVFLYTATSGSSLQTTTRTWITANKADITQGLVFGGTVSVSLAHETNFRTIITTP